MARRNKRQQAAPEEFGLSEVDEFEAAREKVLLEESGLDQVQESDESDQDQEVLGIDDDNDSSAGEEEIERYRKQFKGHVDDEDEQYFIEQDGDEDKDADEEEGWGRSKNDYYGADEEEDEADAKAMQEEALRIQKKHLEELTMDDYMVDEMEEEWKKEIKDDNEYQIENDKSNEDSKIDLKSLDSEGQLEVLKSTYPEFIPLTKELNSLKPLLNEYKSNKESNELINVKYTALSAYLGTIGTYFAMFVSYLNSGEQFSMKDEPIMAGILSTREIWRQANKLPTQLPELEDEYETAESGSEEDIQQVETYSSSEEEEDIQMEDKEEQEQDDDDDDELDITKKRNVRKLKSKNAEYIDDIDAEEKRGRRKTLRFYTSKIDQQENKKDARFQGDQDLPYKERLFERQQRLTEEAKKRGDKNNASAPGVDLDDEDYGDFDSQTARSINEQSDKDTDFYNSIASKKSNQKKSRMDSHQLAVKAAKEGKLAELKESVGDDGKRAVNYQIMKNRGLTPHRNKDNRNSRVKKRKKYATAQKKLKSVRAVYKEQKGAYVGEATGIKKNLSKSVKLV
ncbi:hypothetical protein CANARDRAFT_28378 [[Candida] arabinofermentans NRRL YB-2248]|uniref:Sas10 C-terminal domain-containing protein n=1 Tax=[Candida] arabinofermentans NRRL YB-2248 TaxID=983967 RepID=A0A1E4T1P4_9ASCO|nr:hypothetical protein CANARDRAFT_28378 [[Candida] arabinofermentans NRRL YB-2248]